MAETAKKTRKPKASPGKSTSEYDMAMKAIALGKAMAALGATLSAVAAGVPFLLPALPVFGIIGAIGAAITGVVPVFYGKQRAAVKIAAQKPGNTPG